MRAPTLTVLGALALGFLGVGCADSTLMVHNDSSFDIYELNLSPTTDRRWGQNLLGTRPLYSGESVAVVDIDCDDYDIRVLDEDGDECVLERIELCFDDAVWTLTDTDLAVCSLFN